LSGLPSEYLLCAGGKTETETVTSVRRACIGSICEEEGEDYASDSRGRHDGAGNDSGGSGHLKRKLHASILQNDVTAGVGRKPGGRFL
jgi:hypothetical protein